ncbi:hypothetical protein AGLY_008947 [Aphis glycines]|uniref:Uncharacterized protein n=1 Tax=Aphis glycines TaxID=307491 RepID=A0A6G0TLE0_APHGL|nr:hypothetical protein AGLY_008947 [Aphis glycines]
MPGASTLLLSQPILVVCKNGLVLNSCSNYSCLMFLLFNKNTPESNFEAYENPLVEDHSLLIKFSDDYYYTISGFAGIYFWLMWCLQVPYCLELHTVLFHVFLIYLNHLLNLIIWSSDLHVCKSNDNISESSLFNTSDNLTTASKGESLSRITKGATRIKNDFNWSTSFVILSAADRRSSQYSTDP